MKNLLATLSILFFIGTGFAQERKYPSLLWEISYENSKPSYLYGTMHVSERIAFHLSDVFFEKLLSTDMVALESDPETWLNEMQNEPESMGINANPYGHYQFYSSFQRSPLQNELLKQSFLFNGYMLNGILYRTNEFYNDYQEDTYLDMFIYQVGKRTNRRIVSLEKYKESQQLAEKAMLFNMRFDPPAWAKKMSKDKPFNILMEEAYRDKNLDMIDSINRGMNSPQYNQFMLFERNKNMVRRMDSIFKKGETLFVGIGAAHLPGESGVIEMLRAKGYKVKPVFGNYSDKGRKQKNQLDHAFQYDNYATQTISDGQLSIAAPSKLYEFEFPGMSMATSPDLKNGAHLNVIRLKKYDFLRKNNYTATLEKIDSLVFEFIPGDITKKEKIRINGFEALDISNKTKEGNSQRYWVISTPLEYLIVSMLGKAEFVENQSKNIFNTLKLKEFGNDWQTVSPIYGGYSVQLPAYHNIIANDQFGSLMRNPEIIAYDQSDDSYYFVIEKSINDIEYLEENEFELKRIQYEFYKKLKVDSTNGKFIQNPPSYTSEAKLNENKTIRLKSLIKGAHYYLLGSVANEQKSKKFFDSFKFEDFKYFREPKSYKDTILNYLVNTQLEPPGSQIDFDYYYNNNKNKSDKNYFEGTNKSRIISSETKQDIVVNYQKFPRYGYYETIDSLWSNIIQNNKKGFHFDAIRKKTYKNKDGRYVMDVFFKNPESSQVIKARYIASETGYHSIKTLVDSGYSGKDEYIERFYNEFTPTDSAKGASVFKKKTNFFLEDIESPIDSIRTSALKSVHLIKFQDEDFPALVKVIENYKFKDNEAIFKNDLIEKIGQLKHPQSKAFLENYYRKNSGDSNLQIAVIEAFTEQKNANDYKKIVQLMEEDLPLPSNAYGLSKVFESFAEDPENSSKIFDDLIKYLSIPEYQNYIIYFTANMLDSGQIAPKKIRPYRKDILTMAKMELKRTKSKWMDNKQEQSGGYYNKAQINVDLLKKYINLLQPFSKEKDVQAFFSDVEALDIPDILLYRLEQKLESDENVSNNIIHKISKEQTAYWKLYKILKSNKQLDKLPPQITQEKIALSLILDENSFINTKEDSLDFLDMKKIKYRNKSYEVYFFKISSQNKYSGMEFKEIAYAAFEMDKDHTFNLEDKKNTTFVHSGIEYIDDEYLEETYKNELDRVLFHDKKRVSFNDNYFDRIFGY